MSLHHSVKRRWSIQRDGTVLWDGKPVGSIKAPDGLTDFYAYDGDGEAITNARGAFYRSSIRKRLLNVVLNAAGVQEDDQEPTR